MQGRIVFVQVVPKAEKRKKKTETKHTDEFKWLHKQGLVLVCS